MGHKSFVIGGLPVHVFGLDRPLTPDVAVLFFLHGRLGKWEDGIAFIEQLLSSYASSTLSLLVVTFDQRNHGHRLVSPRANMTWFEKDPAQANATHAMDMHSIQLGTARDCSLLVDYLPSYLFPRGARRIAEFACAGISLGGHATWLLLSEDPRIRVGCPIIGCPDFLPLMEGRAAGAKTPMTEDMFPHSLRAAVEKLDPKVDRIADKHVLVCSGSRDKLVPFARGAAFVDRLKTKADVTVNMYDCGHRCTKEMIDDLSKFLMKNLGRSGSASARL